MEHILISPGKLKLMLSKGDLDHYELSDAARDGTIAPESRRSIRLLLEDAGRLSGFDAGDDKLFIQLYPSKDGGAEIYITRLGGRPPEHTSDERLTLTRIGCFESLNELMLCCSALEPILAGGSNADSSAWSDGARYFLLITEEIGYHEYLERGGDCRIESMFGEFGRNIKNNTAVCYIKEHCFVFCKKNAVKILSDMI